MNDTPRHSTEAVDGGYRPVFSEQSRTVVYIAAMALVIIGSGISRFVDPSLGDWLITVGGYLAAGFGVVYNPIRMAGKSIS